MTVNEGLTADQALSATDADGQALTFSLASGPTYATVTTTTPGTGTATGNLHLAPGFSDAGTASASVSASDGTASDSKPLAIPLNNVSRPPALHDPLPMWLTADLAPNATDAGWQADAYALASAPASATASLTAPATGATTGNIHLAPGFSDAGTASATVQAADATLNN